MPPPLPLEASWANPEPVSLATVGKGVLEAGQRAQQDTQHAEKRSPSGVQPPREESQFFMEREFGSPCMAADTQGFRSFLPSV